MYNAAPGSILLLGSLIVLMLWRGEGNGSNMITKFLWSRRPCCCFLCCGGNCCPTHYHHHHHQKQSNLKSKRDHLHHHRNGGHIWRKTVVFGIFVFTLYFALLSFVSFLAVSNHRMLISVPTSQRSSGGVAIGHVHAKNGSSAYSGNESFGDHAVDKSNSHSNIEKGASAQSQNNKQNSEDGGNVASINSIVKTEGSQTANQPKRDAGYMNDLMRSRAIFKCVPVHYREKLGPTVALASFPGSGNTWLRYLLQLSTGVFTGSVYKDFALLRNGFPAESVTNGRVLVMKTHESGAPARSLFDKAILLVRKPSEAILAEFNRRAAGHIGHAGRDKYTRNAGRYWSQFVAQKGKSWTETNLDWIDRFSGPLLITMYHQLVHNTSQELTAILDFLREPVSDTVMNCVISNKEGIYRRRKRSSTFNPFTPQMEKFLAAQEKIVYNAIQRRVAKETAKIIHVYNNTVSAKDEIFIPFQRKLT